jgi:hypothetical protein
MSEAAVVKLVDPKRAGEMSDFRIVEAYAGVIYGVHIGTARTVAGCLQYAFSSFDAAKFYCESVRTTQGRVFYIAEHPVLVLQSDGVQFLAVGESIGNCILGSVCGSWPSEQISVPAYLTALTAVEMFSVGSPIWRNPHDGRWAQLFSGSGHISRVDARHTFFRWRSSALGVQYSLEWQERPPSMDNAISVCRIAAQINDALAAKFEAQPTALLQATSFSAELDDFVLSGNVVSLGAYREAKSELAAQTQPNSLAYRESSEATDFTDDEAELVVPLYGVLLIYLKIEAGADRPSYFAELRSIVEDSLGAATIPAAVVVSAAVGRAVSSCNALDIIRTLNGMFSVELENGDY